MKTQHLIRFGGLYLIFQLLLSCQSKPDQASLTIYCTSDVHGTVVDQDLKRNRPHSSSLANAAYYLRTVRDTAQTPVILLDNGDFLQGQPSNYYYNFIDTNDLNLTSRIMNYLRYDAASVGNHDIETGHSVYDKIARELDFPWLSANTVNTATGQPYFTPYTILHRNGIKIAILGMTTPGIPKWLPKYLWEGLQFRDMIESARYWVKEIQQKEKPDLLIGLFHSGFNYNYGGENEHTSCNENAGVLVARAVEGFDVIILGHDHQEKQMEETDPSGKKVVILDPKSHATYLGKITIRLNRKGRAYEKRITTELIPLADIPRDTAYLNHFQPDIEKVRRYIHTPLGKFTHPLSGRDGLFGPSAFTDLIHNAQLAVTQADVSFSTVLQKDALIREGEVTVRDMFNLYSYENGLYTMSFTGKEIDRYLEFAYGLQYNTMKNADDHLIRFKKDAEGNYLQNKQGQYIPATDFFNYSCAAGIKYTVNVSREAGDRVTILSMSDGTPFSEDSTYSVAINSYRGNGGGGHLSQGLGWSKEEMEKRIVRIWPQDVRYYLSEYIKEKQVLAPQCRHDWKVIPEKWFRTGKEKDYPLIYN